MRCSHSALHSESTNHDLVVFTKQRSKRTLHSMHLIKHGLHVQSIEVIHFNEDIVTLRSENMDCVRSEVYRTFFSR